jgi:hypothetical protein
MRLGSMPTVLCLRNAGGRPSLGAACRVQSGMHAVPRAVEICALRECLMVVVFWVKWGAVLAKFSILEQPL